MWDFIKRAIFWFWNSKTNPVRDKTGRVIDDLARRKHSKEVQRKLDSGELVRPGHHNTTVPYKKGESAKCFSVVTKGKVTLKKQEN